MPNNILHAHARTVAGLFLANAILTGSNCYKQRSAAQYIILLGKCLYNIIWNHCINVISLYDK